MIDHLTNPYSQILICGVLLLLVALITRFSVAIVIMAGLSIGLLYLPISLFYGVYFDSSWMYLFHLLLATAGYSALWVMLFVIADKFGKALPNGEAAIVMIAPVTVFPAIFAFAVVSKFIFDFIRVYL